MTGVKLFAAVGALVLSGILATTAHAQTLNADPSKALADRNQWGPQASQHKTFEWDSAKSRWGLKLDLDQPGYREMDLNNVQAGAYYKVTPSLRVGGVVSLGDTAPVQPRGDVAPQVPAPRVRLEGAFKF
ncbi:MAG: NtrZ family periplasmic regulatory protein [Alphaproteobacteria bacterium]